MAPRTGVGIDFGTSNSSLATFDGERVHYVSLEPSSQSQSVMPTALYLDRSLSATVGQAAVDAYTRDNAGRSIRLSREAVGEFEMTVAAQDGDHAGPDGSITDWVQAHAYTDAEMPGRLFRSLKRWLGSKTLDRVRVFDARYRLVALVTPILERLRRAIPEPAPEAGGVHLGRPVRFEGRDATANEVAIARLAEAAGYAGLPAANFYPEPVAASLSFLHRHPAAGTRCVLTFDFGGGTLDLCVLRAGEERFDILSTWGKGLGGDAIDALIYRALVFPALGEGVLVANPIIEGPREVPFSFRDLDDRLLNWQLAYELNRPELLERIVQGMRQSDDSRERLGRLYDLITKNLSYQVYRAIEHAKIELSEKQQSEIEIAEIDLRVPITRDEFERLLLDPLDEVERCVDRVLELAGIEEADVDAVVRTGGSSQIPAVAALLERRFPGKVTAHDAFTSIAGGLAIASWLGYEWVEPD
jgi:hypothetical chaperone protein